MDKEIHIYNYNDSKQSGGSSHGYFSKGQLLIVILAVLIIPYFFAEQLKKETVEKPKQQEVIAVEQPIERPHALPAPTSQKFPSGVIETTVSTSVVSSPYTWQFELKDVVTNDSIKTVVKMGITSQIRGGMEKILLQNYGGNWFYTVFASEFGKRVNVEVRKAFSYHDLKYTYREAKVEQAFMMIAQTVINDMSEEYLLPIDIKNVSIVEVKYQVKV